MSTPGARFPGAEGDAVERVVLPNGLTVLVRRDASAPVVAIVTWVKAGYFDEGDDVVGISHVLEHMYFKGTPTRGPGEIARETRAAGGYLNAGTIYDHTSYYAVLPSSGFSAGLAVQADAFAHSSIDAGELARELEVIIEEERRKRDTPSAVATEECYALLHDVHRMRRWRIGMPDVLRRFTRTDVERFYRMHYVPSNTVLCVVGDVAIDRALEEINANYGALPSGRAPKSRGPAEPSHAGFRSRELVRDVRNPQLVMGWRTVPPAHTDSPALDMASALLGSGRASRLFRGLRERSIASSVGAYHYTPTELGVFAVTASMQPGLLARAATAAWSEVARLGEPGAIAAAELERARHGISARWHRALESMEGQAMYLASWEADGAWQRGAAHLDRLLSLSAPDVQRAVLTHLSLDTAALVTVRGSNAAPVAADAQHAREVLRAALVERAPQRSANAVDAPAVASRVRANRVVADVAVFESERGIPILVRRKEGAPIAYAEILFSGGASAETEANAGITSLLARTSLLGTTRRDGPQFSEDVEALGGIVGGGASGESFGWSISAPTHVLPQSLALLAELVAVPSLSAESLEIERAAALTGLARLRDDMSRQPGVLALSLAFGSHAYGRPSMGTDASVSACTRDALREWHAQYVAGGHAVIAIVADGDVDEIAACARSAFGGLVQHERAMIPAVAWPPQGTESVEMREREQTAIVALFPAPRRSDPRRRAASLLSTIASGLGGRLFDTLRDKESLAYTVSMSSRPRTQAGTLSVYLACAPAKEQAARDGLMRECMRIAEHGVTDDEVARAIQYSLGSLAIRDQSAGDVLGDIVEAWMFGSLEDLADKPRQIAALTPADVSAVARESFAAAVVWGIVRGSEK